MGWSVFAAAVTGISHVEGGVPCQDAFAYQVLDKTLVAVVCDGAGSAACSQEGAQFLARELVDALVTRLRRRDMLDTLPVEGFRRAIAGVVDSARSRLATRASIQGADLSSYAATLVGVVLGERGGWFFHIGDGVGAALAASGGQVVSTPENGEYANETYFVTGDEWREHLRLTAIDSPACCVALMSDGASPFVMSAGQTRLYAPFIEPVQRYLAGVSEAEGSRALESTLADPRTHAITSDDKTLLMALWSD